jgi:tetratricopeptide (TPR) repeat protein
MNGTEDAHAPAALHRAGAGGETLPATRLRVAGWLLSARAIPFALAAITFLVFSPALLNGFVQWDDSANLFDNPSYRGLGWKQIRWMFTNTLMGHYIPVTWLTFGLDYTLWGMNPLGYHLTNALLHAAATALFYLVALRLLARATSLTGSALRLGGAMAALFFALHPLRAESVAWATERRDVLSGLFFLVTILMYLKAADAEGRPHRRLLAGSVVCYVLALLSKSIVMTLPLVLVLLDLYPLGRLQLRWAVWGETAARAVLKEKLPYLALGLAGAITSYWAVASNDYLTPVEKYGWPARIAMMGYSLWFYLEKTILPLALSPLYELPAVVNPLEPRFLLSGVAVIAISAALLTLHRRWPAGLAVWVYYGIILGPVTGIVHSGFQLAHDRYSYLSCLGWALLAGAAAGSIARAAATGVVRPWLARAGAAVAAVWILALGTLTWHQIQIWRDTGALWRYAVEFDPGCSICQGALGLSFFRLKLFALAKEKYDLVLALRPDRLRMHSEIGLALQGMGDFEAAMSHHRIAVARYPNDPAVLSNMALALLEQKRYSDAMPHLERANRIDPNYVPTLVNLGVGLIGIGQPEKAVAYLSRALELTPEEPMVHFNLARAYLALGNYEAGRKEYDALVKIAPDLARVLEPAFLPVW